MWCIDDWWWWWCWWWRLEWRWRWWCLCFMVSYNLHLSSFILNRWSIRRLKKFDHITTAIQGELQWLRIGERINFKLCILVHKCLNNCAPHYLADNIRPLSDDSNRSRLRSSKSADVFIPATKTKAGDRAFRVAGPRAWNSLPAAIQEIKSYYVFKKQLKLYLLSSS